MRLFDEEEDEDEETLALKLQAIEARLKLKKLQQAKTKLANESDIENDNIRTTPGPQGRSGSSAYEQASQNVSVLVPLSPSKDRKLLKEPDSPARVRLGIDKGIRAENVSLKRASSRRTTSHSSRNALGAGRTSGLQRSKLDSSVSTVQRSKSFSERITASRQVVKEREEKHARIQRSRSQKFGYQPEGTGMGSEQTASFKTPQNPRLPNSNPQNGQSLSHPANPLPGMQLQLKNPSSNRTPATRTTSFGSQETAGPPSSHDPSNQDSSSIFDSLSGYHLTKRLIPHTKVARLMENKSIFTLPKLLKIVKSPDYEPPDVESDYVVLGIVASKSSALTKKNTPKPGSLDDANTGDSDNKSKFMVLRITDLKWEVDLFLFDTGFSKFWKLPLGAVVAILNPGIMPPRNRDTGQFSMKLSSSEDTILEIGTARDLGFCAARKKDGKECEAWVDKRKTEFCEFHVSLRVSKAKSGRMEVNTMTGFGSGKRSGPKNDSHYKGGNRYGNGGLRPEGKTHDSFLHETMFIVPGATAKLLDEESDVTQALERGCTRAELDRRRLAERERERELASKLGRVGNSIGGEYMKSRGDATQTHVTKQQELGMDEGGSERVDAASLGLSRRAGDVTLSPVKRKRSAAAAKMDPVGWGGAYKRGLLDTMKPSSAAHTGENSPKKRARFMLENKGIREPGRESLGVPIARATFDVDDDDDDLDIVR